MKNLIVNSLSDFKANLIMIFVFAGISVGAAAGILFLYIFSLAANVLDVIGLVGVLTWII